MVKRAVQRNEPTYFFVVALILSLWTAPASSFFFHSTRLATTLPNKRMAQSNHCNHDKEDSMADAKAYNRYASMAVELSNAHIAEDGLLTMIRSTRDIDNNRRRKFLYTLSLKHSISIPPMELPSNLLWRLPSPSGTMVAICMKETKPNNNHDILVLEIWKGHCLERKILLSEKLHGKVIWDEHGLGVPSWNPSECAIVYSAEAVSPTTCSFFDKELDTSNKETNNTIRGGEYTLGQGKAEHWGELYHKQSTRLDLFCVHVETGKVARIDNVPNTRCDEKSSLGGYALGDAVWSPDGMSVVYVGWDAGGGDDMPRPLGLIYCQQRPSKIYSSSVNRLIQKLSSSGMEEIDVNDEAYTVLTPNLQVAKSPRFSPMTDMNTKSQLLFLATERPFVTHNGCFGIHSLDYLNGCVLLESHRIVLGQMDKPNNANAAGSVAGLEFPGIFSHSLPTHGFLSSDYILVTTQWGSCTKVLRLCLSSGKVEMVNDGNSTSEELLCVARDGSAIVLSKSPKDPTLLWHVAANSISLDRLVSRIQPIVTSKVSSISGEVNMQISYDIQVLSANPVFEGVDPSLVVQSIFMLPDKDRFPSPPLIVIPHGGPHSASGSTFYHSAAFLCEHGGYAILMINYRGSTGFGQTSIESLPTRIGLLDVQDVIAAAEQAKASGLVDSDRVGICGGSHGGFLTAHCTSQYPSFFKAAAMRNPVVNIATMVSTSDIPDWCYVEATGSYDFRHFRPPTNDELVKMWDCSPVQFVSQVKTPTLVALGMSDLRVPPSQGLEWYHSLRSQGLKTKLLMYPDDTHPISGVASEADHWINVKKWFDTHLK